MALPIVGGFHRPPAKALTDSLPTGTPLFAIREPDNEFDPNAIRVLVRTDAIMAIPDANGAITQALEAKLAEYGFSLARLRESESWHLGYLPATVALVLAPKLELNTEYAGKLTLSPVGKPMIDIDFGEKK